MRELLSRRPVVPFAVLWTIGYAISFGWHVEGFGWISILLGGTGLWLSFSMKPRGWPALVCMFTLITAWGWYGAYDDRNRTALKLDAAEAGQVTFIGRIMTPVTVDGDRAAFQAEAMSIIVPGLSPVSTAIEGERLQLSIRLMKQEDQQIALGWQRGDRIELTGTLKKPPAARNFGAFDYRAYLAHQHVFWQLTAKGLDDIEVTAPEQGDWGLWRVLRLNDRFRGALASKVDALFPTGQNGFMKGMLIGLTDEIDPEQFDQFSRLGLTHIIAISGLNVAIFLGCLIWLLKRLGLTRETYLWISMAFVPLYILATGASPSIVRAGIMAMIGLYAAYRNRLKDGLHLALLTGTLMLLWNPYYLTDVSFQLSFLVTVGIIILVQRVSRLLPLRKGKWRDAIAITLVAQFVSFPLTITYFNQFSLLSFAANLALVPVFSMIVMPVGTAAMLLGFVSQDAGGFLAWLVAKTNDILFAVVGWSSERTFFQTIWPTPSLLWILLYYGVLSALVFLMLHMKEEDAGGKTGGPMLNTFVEMRRKALFSAWNRRVLVPGSAAALIVLLVVCYVQSDFRAGQGLVQFLDVGQGDSILIRTGNNGHTVLVDGGGTVTFRKVGEEWKERRDPYEVGRKLLVPLLKKRGIQSIDEIILTHQDKDHSGGLQAVLEDIPVKRLLFNGTLKPTPGVEKLFQTALQRGTKLVPVHAGDRLRIDSDAELFFLFPKKEGPSMRTEVKIEYEQNPVVLVFLMELSGTRWLFTGDIGVREEEAILTMWQQVPGELKRLLWDQPIDVLKVAHHGSKSSTHEAWMDVWRPNQAVISVGENNVYGHPSPVVLQRLEDHGTFIHRTDRDGEIQMNVRDGKIYYRQKLTAPAEK